MGINLSNNYYVDIARGRIHGATVVHKFGENNAIGTTLVPITDSGLWQTPTVLTSLEILSSDINDTAVGSGGQQVYVVGIGTNWEEVTETVTLNGTTAVALANQYYRIYRMYVVRSGTYATAVAGSHVGTITLRTTGAGPTWATIDATTFPLGQTEIGVYTVPANKIAYVQSMHIHVDTSKVVHITAFQRQNADDVVAPYTGVMRAWGQYHGLSGDTNINPATPIGPFYAKTDVGFMGAVDVSTGAALVDFEILLFDV